MPRGHANVTLWLRGIDSLLRKNMKFSELLHHITGISCPVFGISWQPAASERTIAKNIIIFLESRRVLYSAHAFEVISHAIQSVVDIKNFLTSVLQQIPDDTELNHYVRGMRIACNKFLNQCHGDRYEGVLLQNLTLENLIFISALGELRGTFGVMIGQIAKAYGIDVEDELAQIIPE